MPKLRSDFPINLTLRISVVQHDYLNDIAQMHGVSPSEYMRALIDAALTAEAKRHIGVPGADDATALDRAHQVLYEASHG